MYLCFVIPSSIFSIVISKINRNKLIHILLFSFSLCSLIHCRARAAWVALFISFILLLLIHHKLIFSFILNFSDNKTIFQSLSIIPLILILFIYFEPDVENVPKYKESIWSTITSLNKDSYIDKENVMTLGERLPLYTATLNMIQNKFLIYLNHEIPLYLYLTSFFRSYVISNK